MTDREVVCIVDNCATDREVFNRILSQAGYLVQDYEDCALLFKELAVLHAACVIMDVNPPEADVAGRVSRLTRSRPDIPCVMTTTYSQRHLAMQAMRAGAVEFVEKPAKPEILQQLVHRVIRGRSAAGGAGAALARPGLIDRLTPRERAVLDLIIQGYQSKMIAYELGISQRTVDVYRARLRRRLNANSFAELVRVAVEEKLAMGVVTGPRGEH